MTRTWTADTEDNPRHFEAIVKHMYGAQWEEVFKGCSKISTETLGEIGPFPSHAVTLLRKNIESYGICHKAFERYLIHARIASGLIKQFLPLYILADKYLMSSLKTQMVGVMQDLITCAWSHTDVLEAIDSIVASTTPEDKLHDWLLEQISLRFPVLLNEPHFDAFISRMPQFRLVKRFTKQEVPSCTLRYCSNISERHGITIYCHRNVLTTQVGKKRRCDECQSMDHISNAKTRMWSQETDTSSAYAGSSKKTTKRKFVG
jgi:hypothetical protein